ncbi:MULTISPECIES: LacI family DNA-binding transcriptional regulator [Curtobacterium]|jgi:DNA-binding LacI/PurR family transcriptional regulator|uniref:LacI family DNA-binding transcriptional regulator n=1 Tax=Curtobacterium TaxID=2034 RepID=UPI0015E89501|nr:MULTISPECIES: LacI family DNA-binding transcriptional regulator [Curtobacterium]MDF2993794.1 LacI family transcriptional regulator [Microbacterium sp.]MBF4592446.1 LacI family DNA-binding transcriptional regulator [Curtobacterium flaccumfaciens]MBO9041997.1 LacI family DNA-binding transcriptional regulator [Curtobacterium flaccumfaciens pv. flaccumfaciens]MBO9046598.1 LacI family DNA-binding transcriptional regulator [Curtobacterium flaccumfaciens pv. flaccumfaciens]MBO9051021.1 LacI family
MATMQQVADRAGVSIATVSFVVNGTKYVTPGTTARVRTAMRELKFRGNVVARALASRRTRIIALLFPTTGNRFSPTTSQFFMSAAERASERGYHLVLWPVDPAGDDLDDLVSGGLVDGVILMEVRMDDPRVAVLTDLDVPFTLIGRTRDSSGLPFVDIDFETTIEDSLDHLQTLGHRRFGLVLEDLEGTPMAGYAPHLRVESTFRHAMDERGLTGTIVTAGPGSDGGRQATSDLLAADPDVTAVLVMKDDSSAGVLVGLYTAGRRVPEDVSVLSIASSEANADQHYPRLSTMVAPGPELGVRAADALIEQLDGTSEDLPHFLLPCTLRIAESTAPAPA